jgi:lipid II:glycine glycyltransferase (peptidoglycan interpeptide bridge formation enzyme)
MHPVQTHLWAKFQKSQGHKVVKLDDFYISFHQIPKTKFSIGTALRGPTFSSKMIKKACEIAKKENSIFIKFEPDVFKTKQKIKYPNLVKSPKEAFFPHSYILNLEKSEEDLLKNMHPKTRYNIKVAQKHGVVVKEMTNDSGFKIYLDLLLNTTKRQKFYLHTKKYHQDLWSLVKKDKMPHIFIAFYKKKPLSAFMIFTEDNRLFYPYGASSVEDRKVMAPTLLMWEVIRFGKKMKLKTFDMWGSLGPDAKPTDRGYGFHRFKQGFGGELKEFVGTYDLVINPLLYRLYNFIDKYRWQFLRLKAKFLKK